MGLERICEVYRERGLVLALGAGVSSGSGIPIWTALLERVAEVACHTDGPRLVSRLRGAGFSLPAIAAILEREYEEETEFREVVREALYRDFPLRGKGGNPEAERELVAHTLDANTTLNAAAAFCAVPGEDGAFVRNPRLHAIVNFNLDALFSAFVLAKFKGKVHQERGLVLTVERATRASTLDRVSVYHPHGYLRFETGSGGPEDALDQLIFTEHQYFDFYDNPYSSFSSTVMFLLREHPWLFVGLSMLDENIRRLLHYSWKEHVQAAGEERRKDPGKATQPRHFALLASSGDEELDRHQQASLEPLGVEILWLKSYEEIPACLRQIYECSGEDWQTVIEAGRNA
ncbi:MAG: hypothetical protein QOJ16_1883 [Acidobacteriota bacterium]|jgi:hypothetical protein|nr:hypothetical protein [Acidobacteriota bacterium]